MALFAITPLFHISRFFFASSKAPILIIFLRRALIFLFKSFLSGLITKGWHLVSGKIGASVSLCHFFNDLPVSFKTSQALMTRIGFLISILSRVSLSRSFKRSWIPYFKSLFSLIIFVSSEIFGILARPSVRALKYKPVPPTIIIFLFVLKIFDNSRNQCPTEYSSSGALCPYR